MTGGGRPDRERVVVTGVGVKSPAGTTVKESLAALLAAESAATTIPELTRAGAVVDFGCTVPEFGRESYLTPKEMRQIDRLNALAIAAAMDAVADSGPHWPASPGRSGVFVGTGIGGLGTMELAAMTHQHRPHRIPAFTVLRVMNSSPAARISARLGVSGLTLTFSTACASGATAIGEAVRRIRSGELTTVLAGGVDAPLTPLVVSAFAAMRALSTRMDVPHEACRPFDDDRDGFVMAEGAAFVVLERLDHAMERGARVYGEVAGYGVNTDTGDLVSPRPTAAWPPR
ncbi:beta-ketoacyl-[acyl-carrier-protein] synthase family protein [Thermocatellispora tengchongensis]|uniref:beta-ketoacyl-[acyl-carrier-protein] synthase family protein n=1 Tax=Thermocatellispora tengchongensis TaxID=1073253 RepID=UPI003638A4AE